MGLPLTLLASLGVACIACSASRGTPNTTTDATSVLQGPVVASGTLPPAPVQGSPEESPQAWPKRSELFLVRTDQAELALRAIAAGGKKPFEVVLARNVGNVLYNAELDLVWYNVESRFFVMDVRQLGPGVPEPVLIARDVPIVGGLRIERDGVSFTAPGSGDDEDGLVLHWGEAPWITAGEEKHRIEKLDGRSWLALERRRPARSVPGLQGFAADGPHVALPGRAQCDGAGLCGAALPFGLSGWQLLVASEDYEGDFPEFRCLFYDRATQAFATPPDARKWAPAQELESGTCGPFSFNAESSVYLASSVVCNVGAACSSLGEGGSAIGWLEPGPMIGTY